ncbi:hypothetical protein [Paludisphaera borealis]|uniref:Glycosyltransferase RgtA/B/C/D-like domain-containing protein n=1 Tax=Paludisphaera borealis TaxID=1387353 RepID=A0A1U7CUY4_9BACT|nr:hypothetical protein [Paludisphaera borealis]APW62745.1 putative glycosyltransferase of unknown function [Paludisphaera borealis]
MSKPAQRVETTVVDPTVAPAPGAGGWGWTLLLGVVLTAVYLSNRIDPIGSEDTAAGELLPMAIARGDGPYLDRFAPVLIDRGGGPLSWAMRRSHGHIISRYAIGPALVSLPLVAAQLAILDRIAPGWDRNPGRAFLRAGRMSKVATALIAALTAMAIHRLLRRLGVGPMAAPATLAVALGSNLWMIASQAPWEHSPAVLMLTLSMIFLTPPPTSPARLLLGGATTAMMVCCRPLDLIFAVALMLRVAFERPRALAWLLPGPILLGSALLAYNLWFFQSVMGGLSELEKLHPQLHGRDGTWSGSFAEGLAGTLFSPNRGLFVFCPWLVLALATLPATIGRLRSWPLGRWMLGALVVDLVMLSKYSVWWAGHSFGPRYWTDAMPIFAVLLGFGLEWAWAHSRLLVAGFVVTIVLAVTVQAIGAFCYPSSWNIAPIDVDHKPSRVWDWADSEVARGLREGRQPWSQINDPIWPTGR